MLNKKLLQRLTVAGLIAVTTIKRIDIPLLKPEIHYKNVSLLVC